MKTPSRLRLGVERLGITVEPGRGGRITSLLDRHTGREWLVPTPSGSPLPRPGDAYVSDYAAGWDECFPNIAPGRHPDPGWSDRPLLDHGEVWCRPWSARHGAGRVVASIEGLHYPYRLERTIAVRGSSATLAYRLQHIGSGAPLTVAWAAHPLLAIESGMRLVVAPGGTARTEHRSPRAPVQGQFMWPETDATQAFELATVPPPSAGWAAKVFVGPGVVGCGVLASDGWLGFRWGREPIQSVGLWLNFGGWPDPPAHHVGLEPVLGDSDDLAVIAERGSGLILHASRPLEWGFEAAVGEGWQSLIQWLTHPVASEGAAQVPGATRWHV